ncbi:type I phosphodiesterase/nucleotide pyrophosphatase [Oscillochloris trichoides DG-6]|uniref:Type I phosphodiesterase/nucleotide pyrophosphatase n=1 Tax=Oscillochloris trichoides DG-6 TaxID=765420 RepID=E1IFX6_9CHLR|nr:alkaline phosphatase family protein [Oscillochloris trichoides]EFO79934.1 type I phosphodiesterase/nucleotide pyrophosphatase [Oscillochloris trichoides DG-6]
MLNSAALAAIHAARWGDHFVRPGMSDYCFSRLPATIEAVLTGAETAGLPPDTLPGLASRYDTVILLFLDAFGWRFFEPRMERYPFLKRFLQDGVVSPLTTLFPSTTAAHVTTLNTGVLPSEHGVFEWFYYEPQVDTIIAPLLFSFAKDRNRETLAKAGVEPAQILPKSKFYHRLRAAGVRSTIIQSREYAASSFTQTVCAGAEVIPFRTVPEALTTLVRCLQSRLWPSYYYVYFDMIDSICHSYSPESPYVDAEIDLALTALERLLHPALASRRTPTLLLMIADHGQIGFDPRTSIMLNRLVPDLARATRTTANGELIVPGGSHRDMFLYLQENRLDEMAERLGHALAGRAEVYRTSDLLAAGFFGSATPSPTFLSRVGNLVVLPYAGESVWWEFGERKFETDHRGMHGGLAPEEAITQVAALRYGG